MNPSTRLRASLDRPLDFTGKVAVITGGGGVLCSVLARALAQCGASVSVLDINLPAAEKVADEIRAQGGQAIAIQADVLKKGSLLAAAQRATETFGHIDILINGAGGNKREATTSDELSFFDLPADAIRWVFELNCIGTVLPTQVFGRYMADQGSGCIINIL